VHHTVSPAREKDATLGHGGAEAGKEKTGGVGEEVTRAKRRLTLRWCGVGGIKSIYTRTAYNSIRMI
jgi:hypothetical protein